jgi:hypothetical protein
MKILEVNRPQNGSRLPKYASCTGGVEDIIKKLLCKILQMTSCGGLRVSNFMFRCPPPSFDNETGETMFLVLNSGRPDYSPTSSRHKTTAIGGDRPREDGMHTDMTLFTAATTVSLKLHVRVAAFFFCAGDAT